MPPWGPGMAVDARGVPRTTRDTIRIAINPESLAPAGCRTWRPDELRVEGTDLIARELHAPLADAFGVPIFVMAVRTWKLFADADHIERLTLGRDLDSPALTRIAARHIHHAATEQADGRICFSELLPGPDECWLTDDNGRRYASELRLVAVDGSALRDR
jgi:hypothetical protein